MDQVRFQDQNITISAFHNEIFVECPKCSQRASVVKEDPRSYFSNRLLKCHNCFHSESKRPKTFTVELNCHCSKCAASINITIPNVNEKKKSIAVKCSKCGSTETYEPRNITHTLYYQNIGKPVENYFGLPLWLSQNFRGNVFWVFNYMHLEYLKQYISAGLRERNGRAYWTMVEKLPVWMTSSKNREKILKLITQMERK